MMSYAPGTIVRKGKRRLVVLDCDGFDTVIATEVGTEKIVRVAVRELEPDRDPLAPAFVPPDLVAVDDATWQEVVDRFEKLRPLIESPTRHRLADVQAVADALGRKPCTIYRWIEQYRKVGRLSVFLRKPRSDRGAKRLTGPQETAIETAIQTKFLTAEKPDGQSVIEEVGLICRAEGIEDVPHGNTIRNRISEIPDRTKMAKRRGKKVAAENFEPIRGHFPGADYPLAVVQIDHTPMDVIVVDEHEGEYATYVAESQQEDGEMPTLTVYETDIKLVDSVFEQATRMAHDIDGGGSQVAVLCLNEALFDKIRFAGRVRDKFVPITTRDDLKELRYAKSKCVFSMPEFVAGLQFHTVILIHADSADYDEDQGLGTRRRYVSRVYLGASRAARKIMLSSSKEQGGPCQLLDVPLTNRTLRRAN